MKKALIYFTLIVGITAIIGACKSDEDAATTTDVYTCKGESGGSGPTIGSVALEEATYLSTCFSSRKIQLAFKNSSEAQYTSYTYGDSSCSGSVTDTASMCMNAISISSTAVTKPTLVDGTAGDNATGYNATATWLHASTETAYLQFSAESTSVFWFNQSETESGRDSNSVWIFKFTKQ